MNKHFKSILSLTIICAMVSLLLALTNQITSPIIKEQESAADNDSLAVVSPGGTDFVSGDISKYQLPETITEFYTEKNGGYVFKITTSGYGTNFIIMCGIDKDGVVKGASSISSNETLGVEKEYGNTFKDKDLKTIEEVETISGATKTTLAYRNAIKDALNAVVILNGGSVDLRDEAQILNDNLSTALQTANGEFTQVFLIEKADNIDAVYKANNDTGFVAVSGELFVGVTKDGEFLTKIDPALKTNIEKVITSVKNENLTEIDITKYNNMPSQVQKAYKAQNGNYVFELKAAGFGINGDKWYNPSGEHINIKVSATKDGEIISTLTVSQKETDGIGSSCGDKSFYSQFDGKTETNYSEIEAISGATITTNGYKTAISKVFEAVKILEGVA